VILLKIIPTICREMRFFLENVEIPRECRRKRLLIVERSLRGKRMVGNFCWSMRNRNKEILRKELKRKRDW